MAWEDNQGQYDDVPEDVRALLRECKAALNQTVLYYVEPKVKENPGVHIYDAHLKWLRGLLDSTSKLGSYKEG